MARPRKRQPEYLAFAVPAPAQTTPETVSINVPLPGELHRQLRIKAITEGLSLKDAVITAIAEWVDG
jgi:hypothetical protein